jgi:hypothetical protein
VTVKPITLNGGQLRQLQAAECLQLMACTTANASMNCPHGTAPSSPVNGDLWTTSAGLYARINGSTVGPLGTSTGDFTGPGSSTADHLVTFADGTGKVGKDSGLSLDTDTALGANSDSKIPSQKAVKTYADAGDAATLASANAHSDALVQGLSIRDSCRLATAAALPANVYSNGSSGVGATLTAVSTGAMTVDGVAPALNDRVLVKNEVTGSHDGIYTVTTVGGIGVLYVLTRATDYDQAADIFEGTYTLIEEGTANAATGWVMNTSGAITVGTTALNFTQFNAVSASDATLTTSDITTNNVSSTKHGFAPKSPADATQFLNGAATPAYAAVKDSDLSTSDITTNNVSTSKHGFIPKLPNDATKYFDGMGGYSVPPGSGSGVTLGSGAPSAAGSAGAVYSRTDQAGLYVNTTERKLAKVQTAFASGSGTPASMTLGATPTAGNLLIAWLGSNNDAHSLLDTSKWTLIENGGATTVFLLAAYRYVQGGDTTAVPALCTGSVSFHAQQVIEISGVTGTWANDFDRSDSLYNQSVTTLTKTATKTRWDNDLVLCGVFNWDGNSNITGGSGYTFDVQQNNMGNYGAWALAEASFPANQTSASTAFTIPTGVTHNCGYISVFLRSSPLWTQITGLPVVADGSLLFNSTGGNTQPISTTLSAALDYAFGSSQGGVLYRGASLWSFLAAGTSSYVLTTNGAGADPSWTVAPGAGSAGTPPTIVQSGASTAASGSITLGAAPTNGNLLVAMCFNPTTATAGTGWTNVANNSSGTDFAFIVTKVAGAGESATQTPISGSPANAAIMMWELHGQSASPVITASMGAPVTGTNNVSSSFPGLTNVLNLGCGCVMGSGATITSVLNMTQDQLVNTGNRRILGAHSDGSKAVAQIFNFFSASVSTKEGIIMITA